MTQALGWIVATLLAVSFSIVIWSNGLVMGEKTEALRELSMSRAENAALAKQIERLVKCSPR